MKICNNTRQEYKENNNIFKACDKVFQQIYRLDKYKNTLFVDMKNIVDEWVSE